MRSIGISGAWPTDLVRDLAAEVERRGFARLWVNDVPGGDALEKLAVAAGGTSRLRLGSGVVNVGARSGTDVAARARDLGLSVDRLDLGIGSGNGSHPVDRVAATLDELAPLGAALWVGALGPRMRQLAARSADGVLLNWLTPAAAREQATAIEDEAVAMGRTPPGVALYVRTAVDPAATPALEDEIERYARFPQYAANFERLGIAAADTVIRPRDDLAARLSELGAAVPEVVLRLVLPAEPSLADAVRILDAVRAL